MCLSLASLQSSLGFIGPPLLARAQGSLRGPRSLFLHRCGTLAGCGRASERPCREVRMNPTMLEPY